MSGVVGELDSGESVDAGAGLESDTIPSLSWAVSLRSLLSSIPRCFALSEHHCIAARIRTCFQYGSVNQSDSSILLDALIGSSLWKPPHE